MTATRHTSATVGRAVELAEAGWKAQRIRTLLQAEGIRPVPALGTIKRWTDPTYLERRNAEARADAMRRSHKAAAYSWVGVRGPEWRLGRIRSLRAAGLSPKAIAVVMSHDFPANPISEDTVRRRLAQETDS